MTISIEKIEELVKDSNPNWMVMSEEFVPGKTPVYYSGPFYDKTEIVAAIDAFLNGKWMVAGEHVHKFEIAFSKKFNVGCSVMVNSGSSANLVMIAALKKYFKWKDGDEIIVSPVGFPTTIAPIVQNGLTPVFVDIEWNSLNFDIEEIRKKITPLTRAIFVSPVLGNPPDMDALRQLIVIYNALEDQQIRLIGDNCDSLGSRWDNNLITDYYTAWTTSFYPAHHITTGEGGMISSNNENFIKLCRSIAWWGRDCYCVGSANLLP
jgi:CDP-6-deoxy-D-xylo-4-hexulose-3-dehydrase